MGDNTLYKKCKAGDENACKRIQELSLEYYRKNKNKKRAYYIRNKDKSHAYYIKNKKRINARSIERHRKYRHTKRNKMLELLGGACVRCGFSDSRALQIDHIKGGGRQEAKKYKSVVSYYEMIFKHIKHGGKKYQLLCANCNWIKKVENNE